jgi:hypothetical protein
MPELLDRIRSEMSARLAELRPLVDEHTRLNAALQKETLPTGRTGHALVHAQPDVSAGSAPAAGDAT